MGRIKVTGEFGNLRRFKLDVKRAGEKRGRERVMAEVGRVSLRELRAGVAAGRSPDGTSWAATTDGRKPLQGSMAGSWGVTVRGRTARLESDHRGAGIHNRGGTITPKGRRQGRGAGGRFARAAGGVLVFNLGGRTVFARKVRIPKRRMVPRNGSLDAWGQPVLEVAARTLAAVVRGA